MAEEKERLDVLIHRLGLAASREKASSQIMSGNVFVNDIRIDKPGTKVPADAIIKIKGDAIPYVSRGGLKLEKAIQVFKLQLDGKVCMDVGASTGGFTDCMLKSGAAKVYAVDVGYGQLAWELRNDNRVVCMERTNIRYVTPEIIGEAVDFASIDVSFISLTKVLPAVKAILKADGEIVCLIKPQFEAGKDKVGKKGVVRDKGVHREVIDKVLEFSQEELGLKALDIAFSPIKGPEGNIEYLLYLTKNNEATGIDLTAAILSITETAHQILNATY